MRSGAVRRLGCGGTEASQSRVLNILNMPQGKCKVRIDHAVITY